MLFLSLLLCFSSFTFCAQPNGSGYISEQPRVSLVTVPHFARCKLTGKKVCVCAPGIVRETDAKIRTYCCYACAGRKGPVAVVCTPSIVFLDLRSQRSVDDNSESTFTRVREADFSQDERPCLCISGCFLAIDGDPDNK